MRFRYIEFKLWWYDHENKEGTANDSYFSTINEGAISTIVITCFTQTDRYPIYPWKEKIIN
jgi:hypothetical protein